MHPRHSGMLLTGIHLKRTWIPDKGSALSGMTGESLKPYRS